MAEEIIQQIAVEVLEPNPLQPRGLITPESLVELVDSIREHGILEPLIIAETPAGYQIIAGERRWRAAKIAGLKKVPCIIKRTTHKQMLEMAIVENVQRIDLNPLERAQAFKKLMDEFSLGSMEIAQRISKSQAYVSNSLRLLTLPDALKDALLNGDVTEGHIRALAAIDDTNLMVEALRRLLKESGNVRRAEDLAREYKAKVKRIVPKDERAFIYSDELNGAREKLEETIKDSKVKLSLSRIEAKMTVAFKGAPEVTGEKMARAYDALIKEFGGDGEAAASPATVNEINPKSSSFTSV